MNNRPPVDEHYLHARLDELEALLTDGAVPLATRLQARDEIDRMRAELDPSRVRLGAERSDTES